MLELPSEIEIQAQALAAGYRAHFAEMDSHLVYTASETVVERDLGGGVWLVGAIDAQGFVGKERKPFFREDKTANPRGKATWKRHWVMSVQALTYALLSGGRLFMVRKAFKSVVPEFDHEWFTVSEEEVKCWKDEVFKVAEEIRRARGAWQVWPLNIEHGCFQFGEKYPCPFYAQGCSKLDFSTPPKLSRETGWHLELKQAPVGDPDVVILDATRIKAWMRCREYYRRTYEAGGVSEPESEALMVGRRFHDLLKIYTEELIYGTT